MILTFDSLPDIIWGTMYGEKCTDNGAIILEIEKSALSRTKKDDSVYYIWGWPGPDANCYKYSDYGITWAFTPEELAPARKWKDVYGEKKCSD